MIKEFNIEEIKKILRDVSPESKIYLGCDSERFKKNRIWWSEYATVIVIHIDSNHGCKVFGRVEIERDMDSNKNKPILRLMNEVYRVSNMYLELQDVLKDKDVEIHLDINPNEEFGSNVAYQRAIGYIKGVCHMEPVLKPFSFAASKVADRFVSL